MKPIPVQSSFLLGQLLISLLWNSPSAAVEASARRFPQKPQVSRRRLKKAKSEEVASDRQKHFLKRVVVQCDQDETLDDCWDNLHPTESEQLIHKLSGLHSLALEVEESVVQDWSERGISFSDDPTREPLWVPDSLVPLPPGRRLQESSQLLDYGISLINANAVWESYQVRGESVRVCVMDTGVYAQHPDLQAQSIEGWDEVGQFVVPWDSDAAGHGTHVTGILTASDNNRGYVGVAPGIDVYVVRVFTDEGSFYGSDVVAAAEACQQAGADIISMSLGGKGFNQGEYDIFKYLYETHGILAVASAGNSGGPELIYPAGYGDVISVTACDQDKKLASFSTFNSFVDICAPGVSIASTYIDKTGQNPEPYASISGTSMASPHVVGVLALMKSYSPNSTAEELLYAMQSTVSPLGHKYALGMVDALAAVQLLEDGFTVPPASEECVPLKLTIQTDQYGSETGYRLRRDSDRVVFWKGAGLDSNEAYIESSCIDPNECYQFKVIDSYGDGILSPGGMTLTYDGDVLYEGGDYGGGFVLKIGGGC
eukprot:Nitzschia sp. Nitz4//scaffold132_size63325//41447//43165//NITZ4_006294-RA/size63325-augustus-gene-0.2-mRNA-1//1//CDS//3329535326//2825//frame0